VSFVPSSDVFLPAHGSCIKLRVESPGSPGVPSGHGTDLPVGQAQGLVFKFEKTIWTSLGFGVICDRSDDGSGRLVCRSSCGDKMIRRLKTAKPELERAEDEAKVQ
jgi:hypothetical protein